MSSAAICGTKTRVSCSPCWLSTAWRFGALCVSLSTPIQTRASSLATPSYSPSWISCSLRIVSESAGRLSLTSFSFVTMTKRFGINCAGAFVVKISMQWPVTGVTLVIISALFAAFRKSHFRRNGQCQRQLLSDIIWEATLEAKATLSGANVDFCVSCFNFTDVWLVSLWFKIVHNIFYFFLWTCIRI